MRLYVTKCIDRAQCFRNFWKKHHLWFNCFFSTLKFQLVKKTLQNCFALLFSIFGMVFTSM